MTKEYKVKNIFNEKELTFNEILKTYLESYLDKEYKWQQIIK